MKDVLPARLDRRDLIKSAVGATVALGASRSFAAVPRFASKRPALADRRFVSRSVEREIARVTARIADPEIAWLFANCYPNTLDTTVEMSSVEGKPDAFVITGDIPCLWLRDSAAQVYPYLPLAAGDADLRNLFRGLIARHSRSILIDPYANAFMRDPQARTTLEWALHDQTDMKPGVAERKWEVDGLCHVVRTAHGYWKATGDVAPFDAQWGEAARAIVRTFREQQRRAGPGPYRFQRNSPNPTETLMLGGLGAPTRKIGLIHSMFRPSDDACVYPFLVPANMFAVSALRQLAILASKTRGDAALATEAAALADEVASALRVHGQIDGPAGRVWAYEVDGYGNSLFMDDANVPSLSGLAYLGCVDRGDPLFLRTESMSWSSANPYFFRGRAGEGIGGPHVGMDQIWPMSLIIRAMNHGGTVARECLRTLKKSHAKTGFMRESFDADDPTRFTRSWFAWANGLFGELIITLLAREPDLLSVEL